MAILARTEYERVGRQRLLAGSVIVTFGLAAGFGVGVAAGGGVAATIAGGVGAGVTVTSGVAVGGRGDDRARRAS